MDSASDPKLFKQVLFRNITIPLALAALLCATFAFLILHLTSANQLADHSNQVISKTHQTLQQIIDAETGLRGFLVTGRDNFLEPYYHSQQFLDSQLDEFAQLISDNPIQFQLLKSVRGRYLKWRAYATDVLQAKKTHGNFLKIVDSERGKEMMDGIRSEMAELIRNEERLRDRRTSDAEAAVRLSLVCILLGTGCVGIFLALYSKKQLLVLSADYGNALQKQSEQNESLKQQEWLQSGQTKISYEMRGEQNIEVLSQSILNFLAEYVNASAGALYVLNETRVLQRSAAYAISGLESATKKKILLGESLVGQAAVDNWILSLSQVPENYLQISSGLGKTTPGHLMVVPAFGDGSVRAVFELAFIQEPSARIKTFFERVSESIALAIRSSQYRVRLQSLLEESQAQAEELQSQQEEMRVNNEELEEQSRGLKESQTRLESQQAELEQTNSQLEEQARKLEEQADQLLEKNSDLNQTRMTLEQKAYELELSGQYKSQFLANMSHELRTPLNSTLILAQLLSENKKNHLSEDEVEYAKTILGSCNDLLNLINDILDLSKVEAGKIDLHPEKIDLPPFLKNMERLFRPISENKKLDFTVRLENKMQEIETDQQRLEQILKNLLSNALKFTENGSVSLTVGPWKNDLNTIAFTVKDSGIGIAKSQQSVIFEAFKQADGTTSRKFGGTGLGLAISKDLAKLLGGWIEVESEEGKGSSFTLVLPKVHSQPLDQDLASTTAPVASVSSSVKKVPRAFSDDRDHLRVGARVLLVVEDDQNFSKILYDLSHEMNFQCLTAPTAEEGILLAETYFPQAVILDMNLPDHNGLTVLDQLKANPKTRHIPVHIVSVQDSSPLAFHMGAIGYLTKPVDRDDLKKAIQRLEGKLSQEIKKVLVVEDNPAQREAIGKLIEDTSVRTTGVGTGQDALDALHQEFFDCMIVDLTLPDMSGMQLLEKMSQMKQTQYLPVIVYTGREISKKEEDELKRYSNRIILKGARSPERLLSEVTLFLHQVESKMAPERQKTLKNLRDREKIFEGRRILLVDDDVRNIFALGSALESKGATVITARNGVECVEQVQKDAQIDLVLMDIMMPEMDGYEATRRIRNDPRFAKLPIIAVTAKAMPDDQRKCLDAGTNDYLSKPVDLQKLLSLIRVWMPKEGKPSEE